MTAMTSSPSTVIAVAEPVFSNAERLALAGFLTGYTGLTREAYALDLRQFTGWCQQRHLRLFQVRRADIECFARDLEAKGRARATSGCGSSRPPAPTSATPARNTATGCCGSAARAPMPSWSRCPAA